MLIVKVENVIIIEKELNTNNFNPVHIQPDSF